MDFVKGFIRKIKQDEYSMPHGPVISTPYSNYGVLAYKIWKSPTAFKKAILRCITDLFPENPLAAGIGDKEADMESYLYAGISPERCFMLDDKGNVCITATSESFVGYAGVGKQIKILFPEIQATALNEITDVSSQNKIAES
jgi:phosphatidate phosphatase PAH1